MPNNDVLERFIKRVEENAHIEAVEEFYTADASMQENQSAPRIGRELHVKNERAMLERARTITSTCIRPIFINDDKVVIRWRFRFEWKDGTVTDFEELSYQTWTGDRIATEQFFYDPKQQIPKTPDARS